MFHMYNEYTRYAKIRFYRNHLGPEVEYVLSTQSLYEILIKVQRKTHFISSCTVYVSQG